jgi:UDP:flavonoid glycosyltransferase YjiC (YdhE family)
MLNVVLATKGSYGDVVPFLAIGKAMRQRGHNVTLVSQCEYREAARRVELHFDCWDTPDQYKAFIKDGPLLDAPNGIRVFSQRHVFPYVESEYATILRHCREPKSILVVRHMSSVAASFISEQFELPLVSVFTAAAQAACLPMLIQLYAHCLGGQINAARRACGLGEISDWKKWVLSPDLHLACWPEWFASVAFGWPARIVHTGFLQNDEVEPSDVPPAINQMVDYKRPSAVLITGGTAMWKLAERFYASAAQACSILGRPGILVCRHPELLPSELPSGVTHQPRLPFAQVIGGMAAIIHHGGASVLVRALTAGVPQLVLPYGGDRPDNGTRLERLGVAKRILPPQWDPSKIALELSRLITSDSVGRSCVQLRGMLMETKELEVACRTMEMLLESEKVPAVQSERL